MLSRDRRHERYQEWVAELAAEYDERRVSGLLWSLALLPVCAWEATTGLKQRNWISCLKYVFAALILGWLGSAVALQASGHWVFAVADILLPLTVLGLVASCAIYVFKWIAGEEDRDADRLAELPPAEFFGVVEAYLPFYSDDDCAKQRLERLKAMATQQAYSGQPYVGVEEAMDLASLFNAMPF